MVDLSKGLCVEFPVDAPAYWIEPSLFSVAVAVCNRCPEREACAEAGRDEQAGVWGGTTPTDRGFSLVNGTRLVKPIVHGTKQGYERHGCHCDGCKAAVRESSRIRKRRWLDRKNAQRMGVEAVMEAVVMPDEIDIRDRREVDVSRQA